MRVALLASSSGRRDAVAKILEAHGHETAHYEAPAPALALLREKRDIGGLLVIADDDPDAGLEVLWDARLCASAERPLYIGLLSAPLPPHKIAEALDCGADDVLALPLAPEEIYARLRSAERLNQLQLKLVELATRDGLTRLYNRQAFFRGVERLVRDGAPPGAAIMVDVDHFKSVNDRFGHAAGDDALKCVAEILAASCAHAARLGGEEFVLVPAPPPAHKRAGADGREELLAGAVALAESLREKIIAHEIVTEDLRFHVSCSFGVAIAEPGAGIDDLLRHADAALYAAKHAGRNRVMVFDPAVSVMIRHDSSVVRHSGPRAPRPRKTITKPPGALCPSPADATDPSHPNP